MNRFSLEDGKIGGPKKKFRCPSCDKPKRFTRYQDVETGERLPEEFGVCDRVNSCGYAMHPDKEFFEYWLKEKGEWTDTETRPQRKTYKPAIVEKKAPALREIEKPQKMFTRADVLTSVRNLKSGKDNFANWLYSIAPSRESAAEALKKYAVGSEDGYTLFWHVTAEGEIWNAKTMRYKANGRRDKENARYWKGKQVDGYRQALFGLHLLRDVEKGGRVYIVESEKTAVVASMFLSGVFIATGGAHLLTEERMPFLKDCKVVLIPDNDKAGLESYTKKKDLLIERGINAGIVDLSKIAKVQGVTVEEQDDLADIIPRIVKTPAPKKEPAPEKISGLAHAQKGASAEFEFPKVEPKPKPKKKSVDTYIVIERPGKPKRVIQNNALQKAFEVFGELEPAKGIKVVTNDLNPIEAVFGHMPEYYNLSDIEFSKPLTPAEVPF